VSGGALFFISLSISVVMVSMATIVGKDIIEHARQLTAEARQLTAEAQACMKRAAGYESKTLAISREALIAQFFCCGETMGEFERVLDDRFFKCRVCKREMCMAVSRVPVPDKLEVKG
jgi:heme exporter protein D